MNIEKLDLIHFRNYDKASFSFEKGCIHCLYGKNAQGKTNVIEAIYFLSHLHSFRTNQLNNLVKEGEDSFIIRTRIETKGRNEDLQVIFSDRKKHLFRYQDPIKKYSDFVGIVNAVLFCPDDMMMFQQSPRIRRHFIDIELIKLSIKYTSTLSHYQKVLHARNMLLKQEKPDEFLLETYTDQLIQDQIVIIRQRNQFVKELIGNAQKLYPFFSKENEIIDAQYRTFVPVDDSLKENLTAVYKNSLERDKRYRQTTLGIHKDDLDFIINGKLLREIASQGQKRSFLLALKLGLTKMIEDKTGQYPILLLDDVFSELDEFRRRRFIQILPGSMQIFITTTDKMDLSWFKGRKVHFYEIDSGKAKEVT